MKSSVICNPGSHAQIAGTIAFLLVVCIPLKAAPQVCALQLADCPESYNGDTIVVPDNVIALSSNIHACRSSVVFQDLANSTKIPSIMFVIDHSGSMTGANNGNNPNDQWGSRYTVTRALLDTIFKAQPSAEVGIVVFQEHLFFDITSTQYFADYFKVLPKVYDNTPDQAYFRLLRLNQTYGGKRGIDIIKDVLATDTVTVTRNNTPYKYVDLNYKPKFSTAAETNINIAFEAARQAFTTAANPPEEQFVIFLSDGEPYGNAQMGLNLNDFQQGKNVPTTFTVYFTSAGTAPQSLQTMTQNIGANGYSTTNPQSNLWTIQTNYNDLMRLFMDHILTNILVPGNPTRLVVNGTRTSTTYVDSTFMFSSFFPLNSTGSTSFTIDVTYRYSDQNDHIVRDSIITTTFYIKHKTNAPIPSNITVDCQDIQTPTGDSIPVTATLLDTSGDGHLDRIDLTWTDTAAMRQDMPSVSELVSRLQITSLDGMPIDLHAVRIVPDMANKRISIILTQNSGAALETGWQSAKIELTNTPMSTSGKRFAVARIVDGAGPVVKEVRYYKNAQTGRDSLAIVFSEPVTWASGSATPQDVFYYYRRDSLKTEALSGIPSSDMLMEGQGATVIMSNAFEPVGGIDSLQLQGQTGRLTDASGNNPPRSGRKAPIIYEGEELKISVLGNPFVPGESEISPEVLSLYASVISHQPSGATVGTIVSLQTPRPLEANPDGSYGSVYIYDAVGHVVKNDTRLYQAAGITDYGLFWDGRNRNGRIVGAGTYLVVIEIKNIDGEKQEVRTKIGVKH